MTTTKIGVTVSHRDGFKGVFAAGMHWPDGTTYRLLEDAQIKSVLAKDKAGLLRVVAIGDAACDDHAELEKDAQKARGQLEKAIDARLGRPPDGVGPRGGAPLAQPAAPPPDAEEHRAKAQQLQKAYEQLDRDHDELGAREAALKAKEKDLAERESAIKNAMKAEPPPPATTPPATPSAKAEKAQKAEK